MPEPAGPSGLRAAFAPAVEQAEAAEQTKDTAGRGSGPIAAPGSPDVRKAAGPTEDFYMFRKRHGQRSVLTYEARGLPASSSALTPDTFKFLLVVTVRPTRQ